MSGHAKMPPASHQVSATSLRLLRLEVLSIATIHVPEVVSDVPYDFKKMLESCPQELLDGLPIPVNMGILERVEFLAP